MVCLYNKEASKDAYVCAKPVFVFMYYLCKKYYKSITIQYI